MIPTSPPPAEAGPALEARRARVAARRQRYRYDHRRLAPFAVAAEVPPAESYSVEYHAAQMRALVLAAENLSHAPRVDPWAHPARPGDYAALFARLPPPGDVIAHSWEDWYFAEQRVAGVNPLVLRAVGPGDLAALTDKVPVTDAHLRAAAVATGLPGGRASLAEAAGDGHLFVADYALLDGLGGGVWPGGRKYLVAPVAVFVWRGTGQGDAGELAPVAIQLGQTPGAATPVFTPADPEWRLARLFVQVADANHHEMASHLAGTHLAVEPFALATRRQLADEHPVARLLAPHLRFTIARNREAQLRLINPGGTVDELLAGALAGSLEIARRARRGYGGVPGWGLKRDAFPADLAARGVADPARLPHYPYRDDGRLLWDSIGAFVREYLGVFYPDDAAARGDAELGAWAAELADPARGAVPEMPAAITGVAELAEVLTAVIFTAGPKHAATNFPQYAQMGFVSNMPFAAYRPPPTTRGDPAFDPADYVATLPPATRAAKQLVIAYSLSAYRHDRLGHYPDGLVDPRVAGVVVTFRRSLAAAEEEIRARNLRRRVAYPYLRPSLVPNSISV